MDATGGHPHHLSMKAESDKRIHDMLQEEFKHSFRPESHHHEYDRSPSIGPFDVFGGEGIGNGDEH